MKHIFKNLERVDISKSPSKLILIDTCFLIDIFDKNQEYKFETICNYHKLAITSFNAEEVVFNIHRFREKTREHLKHFLKNAKLLIVDIPVSPGSREKEEKFVNNVDKEILGCVRDPSDAVLVAAAIRARATILTKDKHHLFTATLANFLNKYDISVHKELKDILI